MELLVPGTPGQVWSAMATGPGNAGWFVRGEIEPRVGGVFKLDFGQGAISTGEVTRWEPPFHFGYVERDWQPGAPPVATEITVTSRSGDQCIVRMVHSLFTSSDEWDTQVEGFEQGWPGFFAVLRLYLAHFAGAPAASFMVMTPAGDAPAAWLRLGGALGFAGLNVGERGSTSSAPEKFSGVVEHVYQDAKLRFVAIRIEEPSPGIILAGTLGASTNLGDLELKAGMGPNATVSVNRYYYGDDAAARAGENESPWREWLARTFDVQVIA
jgi:uncharacterized protein YndB with AHSA1/START domain